MATNLSYREKSLYASLVAELLVYGPYFFLHQQNSVNKVAGMIVCDYRVAGDPAVDHCRLDA